MSKLILVAVLSACQSAQSSPASPAASGPLTFDWLNEHGSQKFAVKGGGEGRVTGLGTKLVVHMEKFPKGTRYTLAGESGQIDHFASAEVDVRDKLGPMAIDGLEKVATGLSLELT